MPLQFGPCFHVALDDMFGEILVAANEIDFLSFEFIKEKYECQTGKKAKKVADCGY